MEPFEGNTLYFDAFTCDMNDRVLGMTLLVIQYLGGNTVTTVIQYVSTIQSVSHFEVFNHVMANVILISKICKMPDKGVMAQAPCQHIIALATCQVIVVITRDQPVVTFASLKVIREALNPGQCFSIFRLVVMQWASRHVLVALALAIVFLLDIL